MREEEGGAADDVPPVADEAAERGLGHLVAEAVSRPETACQPANCTERATSNTTEDGGNGR
jgi:hypothetical protein